MPSAPKSWPPLGTDDSCQATMIGQALARRGFQPWALSTRRVPVRALHGSSPSLHRVVVSGIQPTGVPHVCIHVIVPDWC